MIPILNVQCESGKFHAITTLGNRSLVVTKVRTQRKKRCNVPWGPNVEGFVLVRTLSIFDERLDESVELQMGASNNANPLSALIALVDHLQSRISNQSNIGVFQEVTGVTNWNGKAKEARPHMVKRVSGLSGRISEIRSCGLT